MPFKIITKEEATAAQEKTAVNLQFYGEKAVKIKKLSADSKVSIKDVVEQMVDYCLGELDKKVG